MFRFACLIITLLLATAPVVNAQPADLTAEQDAFLDELSRRSFDFFWREANTHNGLIPDRAMADGSQGMDVSSIASVGYGLTAYVIGMERGWISRDQAYDRSLATLKFFRDEMEHVNGFYYHFVDMDTGERVWQCELSSIDTALLINGVLTVKAAFPGTELETVAQQLYDRVDWVWMMNGGETLTMGWKPETGFLKARWHDYNELMMLYLLGMGSQTHTLPPEAWHAWKRNRLVTYGGRTFLECPPLFTHQFSHAWFDFRDQRDDYADYWSNSVLATLAQQQFVADLASRFPRYGPDMWGLTAADGPDGYRVIGAPPAQGEIDGAVVPCAPAGSIPMAPDATIPALMKMKADYPRSFTTYGFVDAFNPHTDWYNQQVIGIDVGITLLMAENHRSGLVWKVFGKNPEVQRAMKLAGFRPLTDAEREHTSTVSIFTDQPLPPDQRNPKESRR
ncbi:glucoamylase family protein [Mucisphaera calidilacus]|uniref:Glycoamylase-like domain-containing protein n=1 Tax=Mucisphaera calidilacus TaxID=2527982 RepID=A0A518BUN0_9BACT|nr:glucoamylase family protein [Mucisphaera calidilacus]QDU70688.1 hypothetical protein Pan265_05180 [Mucisphaera calidilacus]